MNRADSTYYKTTLNAIPYGTLVGTNSTGKARRERFAESINYRSNSSGKERDEETGFGYFGARYYDSELLTGWMSVDPMADKYPGLSPYSYCAWNPIKLVDPDGMEFGDYYDGKGNYLGWDGNIDNYVYIVGNRSDAKKIKNNDQNGKTTSVNDLQSKPDLETSYGVIREACDVLNRAESNSNQTLEECSIVDFDLGVSVRSQTGESQSAELPNIPEWMSKPVSIHSHNKYNDATIMSGHRADNNGDADHFGDFFQNVIVGPLGVGRTSGLCFYPNTTTIQPPEYMMLKSEAQRILGQRNIRLLRGINKVQ